LDARVWIALKAPRLDALNATTNVTQTALLPARSVPTSQRYARRFVAIHPTCMHRIRVQKRKTSDIRHHDFARCDCYSGAFDVRAVIGP
jgi:nitrite reductase/ring-hydroxylating ferredoxin subunit